MTALGVATPNKVSHVLARLDAWLETMRTAPADLLDRQRRTTGDPLTSTRYSGYGGPVVHWWRDSVLYCGPGFDWRYEGIILGYLALHTRTGERRWLEKAIRAGDDLVAAQLPTGNYRYSGFELNPVAEGTPHEAAVDSGLLALAAELKSQGIASWQRYLAAARQNLARFYIGRLWDDSAKIIRDDPNGDAFVPNKAATAVEALFRLADITEEEEWLERYARPTVDAILRSQFLQPGHPLDGGIVQNSIQGRLVEKYFPLYIARCVPTLIESARRFGDDRYLDSAIAAGAFVLRWRDVDGAFPQVVYPHGRINRYPRWVAGVGDILRALDLLRPYGLKSDTEATREWLLSGQLASGAFRSAEGFGSQVSQRLPLVQPDMRDLLPVVGWTDKAFRYLATIADAPAEGAERAPVELACTVHGRPAVYREDDALVEVMVDGHLYYHWRKGDRWATSDAPAVQGGTR